MKRMPSTSAHQFSQAPQADIPRSSFDRSHGYKTTFDSGYLIPFFVDEALPGDTFTCSVNAFARLATPIYPTMDNMFMDTFFFAVPYRLVWDNWERFNGAQDNPGDSTDFTIPVSTAPGDGYSNETLQDYMGVPTLVGGLEHNCLHMRAYNLIWNEWFRDENLQDSITVDKDDGPDDPADYVLKRRAKNHDYFTSALPWPQKGDAVDLPLGTSAPIVGIDQNTAIYNTNDATEFTLRLQSDRALESSGDPSGSGALRFSGTTVGLEADLTSATAATINQLRQAFQIQKLLERDARGGTRYIETVKAHFGVTSPDARLQRPEYLGGGSSPVILNPVAQTSSTDATTPQGNLSAVGTSSVSGHGFTKSFTEHCLIIGLVNTRADLSYQQGLNRMWSRQTRYDFYWPALAHIGEQAVLNKEIYAQGTADDDGVFGYQERFAEYRYAPSKITGKFRSNDPASLDAWHYAQDFASLPTLSASFIESDPPIDRTVATPDEPHFLFDSYIQMRCARPMPLYGVPGLIDHF